MSRNKKEIKRQKDGDATPLSAKDTAPARKRRRGPKQALRQEVLHLGGVLFIITAVVAGMLGLVNHLTQERLKAIELEKLMTSMQVIVPGGQFSQLEDLNASDPIVQKAYLATVNGKTVGLCVEVRPKGFVDEIVTMVGVDPQGRILGVDIPKMSETGGLGSKAQDPVWLAQYQDKTGPLAVVKLETKGENDILAITAATVTSQAVTTGVQAAVDYANSYFSGGDS